MENNQLPCSAEEVNKQETEITASVKASMVSNSHQPLMSEDFLEPIFSYLDISSIKQCRLVCSSWTVTATNFLMRQTFFKVPLEATVQEEIFHQMNLFSSAMISEDLLPQLSPKTPNFSTFKVNWKSVFVSLEPSPFGISSLTSFLDLISSGQCPQVSHLKIHFKNGDSTSTSKKIDITTPLPIQSLHLRLDDDTNVPGVSAFLQVLLRKEVVPNLKELVVKLPDGPGRLGFINLLMMSFPLFHENYKNIVDTLGDCDEVLGSLRILKIEGKITFGIAFTGLHNFLDNVRRVCHPIRLGVSSELKELQLGSGLIQDSEELSNFLPGILTPSVAAGLQSLDLRGIYSRMEGKEFLKVTFPQMPCLRKLRVEEGTIVWIKNLTTIFEKAPEIREFRMNDSYPEDVVSRPLTLEDELRVQQWEDEWKVGEYPSLRVLEFPYTMYVAKFSSSLQKLSKIFPNVEVLKFGCDEDSRSVQRKDASFKFKALPEIVEGLEGWSSLKRLKVTYRCFYSLDEILDHFVECATKLTSLRLYDFHRRLLASPSHGINCNCSLPEYFRKAETLNDLDLNRVKEKMMQLKSSPRLLFVLHNFQCQHKNCGYEDSTHGECSVMKELMSFAGESGIINFREALLKVKCFV